jgi:ribosomal protein L20
MARVKRGTNLRRRHKKTLKLAKGYTGINLVIHARLRQLSPECSHLRYVQAAEVSQHNAAG